MNPYYSKLFNGDKFNNWLSRQDLLSSSFCSYMNGIMAENDTLRRIIHEKIGRKENKEYRTLDEMLHPSREEIIYLAVEVNLNIYQLQYLLILGGKRRLQSFFIRDAAILYSMQKGFGIKELNILLMSISEKPVG